MTLQIRRYDTADSDAVCALNDWAMRDAGTDPTDIPGHEDVTAIESVYFDAGGSFLVGVCETPNPFGGWNSTPFETTDGFVVAMGGFLPSEQGYEDERTVPGAAELHRMRVAPPAQGRGYGRAILQALEAEIARAGYEHVLATTATHQTRALAFYPAHGYERVGTSQLGEFDLVHFEKRLAEGSDK